MKCWLIALAACGRIDFAPAGPIGDGAAGGDGATDQDATQAGDGATASDGPTVDGAAPVCAGAIDIGVGVSAVQNSCDGPAGSLSCGSAGTQALLYRFVVPASASYTFKALNATDNNITNRSVAILDDTCTGKTTCSAIFQTNFSAGHVVFFAVGSSVGGCTQFRMSITSP